MNYIRNIVQI